MKWRERTLDEIAEMICGNGEAVPFIYRSSSYLTRFFRDADTVFAHDGSTRAAWVSGVLKQVLEEPHADAKTPPATFSRVIATLMDVGDATDNDPDRSAALSKLNTSLAREGFEAFYAADRKCYLRHIGTGTVAAPTANPHRPFSRDEQKRRDLLAHSSTRPQRTNLLKMFCCPCSDNSDFIGSPRRAIKTKPLSTARTFGCATRCPRNMCSTSVCKPRETSLMLRA